MIRYESHQEGFSQAKYFQPKFLRESKVIALKFGHFNSFGCLLVRTNLKSFFGKLLIMIHNHNL